MLYDWGVHLIDQILDMIKSEIISLYADVQNVINEKVDDYFNIIMKFRNGITAEIELGTYYLTPKRAWFIGGQLLLMDLREKEKLSGLHICLKMCLVKLP